MRELLLIHDPNNIAAELHFNKEFLHPFILKIGLLAVVEKSVPFDGEIPFYFLRKAFQVNLAEKYNLQAEVKAEKKDREAARCS